MEEEQFASLKRVVREGLTEKQKQKKIEEGEGISHTYI